MTTEPPATCSSRGGPVGIDLATDGSGATIDSEFTGQTGTASLRIEISCG